MNRIYRTTRQPAYRKPKFSLNDSFLIEIIDMIGSLPPSSQQEGSAELEVGVPIHTGVTARGQAPIGVCSGCTSEHEQAAHQACPTQTCRGCVCQAPCWGHHAGMVPSARGSTRSAGAAQIIVQPSRPCFASSPRICTGVHRTLHVNENGMGPHQRSSKSRLGM